MVVVHYRWHLRLLLTETREVVRLGCWRTVLSGGLVLCGAMVPHTDFDKAAVCCVVLY